VLFAAARLDGRAVCCCSGGGQMSDSMLHVMSEALHVVATCSERRLTQCITEHLVLGTCQHRHVGQMSATLCRKNVSKVGSDICQQPRFGHMLATLGQMRSVILDLHGG